MKKLNKLKLYEEFVEEPTINHSYIKAKMKELSELVNYTLKSDFDKGAHFEYGITEDDVEITLVYRNHEIENSITLQILFNLDSLILGFYMGGPVDYEGHEEHFRVSSIEEGMECIEKKIYDAIGVSEKKEI